MTRVAVGKAAVAIVMSGVTLALPSAAVAVPINVAPATGTLSATNNDYQQIENAVTAVNSGDEIVLDGTFDWTEPNAASSWALGNDGTTGNADDFSIVIPPNKNNVTIRAITPGGATIQGPGDLLTQNLEGVFLTDGGDNQNLKFSGLRILDFDLAIGMFSGAGGADAFNGAKVIDNFIRVPADNNATAAPPDVNQNIGIHYSFGTNQEISGNTIQLAGNAVSVGSTAASDIGMQSNTSGGAVYDGLVIEDNVLEVLNAQAAPPAQPERILGIWENGAAHTSDITVRNNEFTNLAAGNNPVANLQSAFRVTSHSSAMTTVTYEQNDITGANIGYEWLTGLNFSGNQPVRLTANDITDANTGVLVQSQGIVNLFRNEIVGSGPPGGVRVTSGTLMGIGGGPAASENVLADGAGAGLRIDAGGSVSGAVAVNELSNNAGVGIQNSGPALDAKLNWWGTTDPAVIYDEVAGGFTGLRPHLRSGVDEQPGTRGFQGDPSRITIDSLSSTGNGSPDSFSVEQSGGNIVAKHGATTIANGPLTEVHVHGTPDVDTLTVDAAGGSVVATTGLTGAGGDDALVVDDSTRATGQNYVASPGALDRSAGAGDVAFAASTEKVEVRGGSGADSFDVTPSADTVFDLRGNDPTTVPGDTLTYRATTQSPVRTPATGPDGEFTDSGVQKVLFGGIEESSAALPPLPPPNAPSGDPGGGGGPQPPPGNADVISPVATGLRLSPSRIAKRGRRQRPIPTVNFTLSEDANVELALFQKVKGRRVGNRCSTRRRTGRRCTILRRKLAQSVAGKQGANRVRLSSRVRRLARGDYQLTLVATDSAGNKSTPRRANLKIIR